MKKINVLFCVLLISIFIFFPCSSFLYAYPEGQCTAYSKEMRSDLPNTLGNAKDWAVNAETAGFPVDNNPKAGDIAVFQPGDHGADSVHGHVAYVESVNDNGTFNISEKNVPIGNTEVNHRTLPVLEQDRFIRKKGEEIQQLQMDFEPSQEETQSGNLLTNWFKNLGDSIKGVYDNVKDFITDGYEVVKEFFTEDINFFADASNESVDKFSPGEVQRVQTEEIISDTIPEPTPPKLVSPYDWYQSLGESPNLIWEGDENSIYYFVQVNSSNTGNIESGWITSSSWKPPLPNENYIYSWKVKSKNSVGIESSWSKVLNFSITSNQLAFEGEISFDPSSPSSEDKIKIFATTTGWGGVGVTLKVSVNTANDGSSNGSWIILKELGVPKFNNEDAPVWDTRGWTNGTYLIRVEAKGPNDPYWQNATVIEKKYKLINKEVEETITDEIVESKLADLVVTDLKFYRPQTTEEVTPQAGEMVTVFAVLKNLGGEPTPVFNIKWYLDGAEVGYGSHASLSSGSTSSGNVRYDWHVTEGSHTLKFVADCDGGVNESNEGNNNRQESVSVP